MTNRAPSLARILTLTLALAWICVASVAPASAQSEAIEFFESKIRPVLVEHCYECHNSSDVAEGELAVDWREGIRKPSSSGTAVVPFAPDESLLLRVIRHEISGLEMPSGGPALSSEVISDFEKWIADGAVDPRSEQPTAGQHAEQTSWEATLARRIQWWSFQPIQSPAVPEVGTESSNPIDAFIEQKLVEHDLEMSPRADRPTLARRLSYVITGLPPTREQLDKFVHDQRPDAYVRFVDDLLASPAYGEHWARHWMDLMRYADSHGSEGDPPIPHAYRYRDFLIRAFNQDVPYDQLVREHLAGDLLREPRINRDLGINESEIGLAHWRLVFHGFAPTDALEEKVRFTDDQINVLGKAFQGLTVSCARCHDHKFDAISQADYYAIFGVLDCCRPVMRDVNLPEIQQLHQQRMEGLKNDIRQKVAQRWIDETGHNLQRLVDGQAKSNLEPEEGSEAKSEKQDVVSVIWRLRQALENGQSFDAAWKQQTETWRELREAVEADRKVSNLHSWRLDQPSHFEQWHALGNGLTGGVRPAGDFSVTHEGQQLISGIYPAGVYTHSLSTRHRGVLGSPRFQLEGKYNVWFQVMGGGGATVRYVVQHYPRDGTVYPIQQIRSADGYWHHYDLEYWQGDEIHLELATSRDAPLKVGNQARSWFGIRRVVVRDREQPPPVDDPLESLEPVLAEWEVAPPSSLDEVVDGIRRSLRSAILAWRGGQASDAQALLLNDCVKSGLLVNDLSEFESLSSLVNEYRRLESELPQPTRVPGIAESEVRDHPLFHRGDHRQPRQDVPRRFLEALDSTPFSDENSGRLQLAEAILAEENPLTARVIVNRIWHYVFGAGIVRTPDNFGQMGDVPTHPELLDFLANRMRQERWSIKQMIRLMVTSQTWQQQSAATRKAERLDPENRWCSHANVRRLPAEAIRDSLLAVSGELDETMYGPAVPANSPSSRRRSIYVRSNRNSLDAFLQTFDAPIPFSTTGRRQVTNVPAQSLTLMNDPFVIGLAERVGEKFRSDSKYETSQDRIRAMFRAIVGRRADREEVDQMQSFMDRMRASQRIRQQQRNEISKRLKEMQKEISSILEPAKTQLIDQQSVKQPLATTDAIAEWQFRHSPVDVVGGRGIELRGDTKLTAEGLVLSGRGFAITEPLDVAIGQKTLEVWLRLDNLDQQGGGAMTVQDLQGNQFDSIVFGEQQARHWLAGSDFFRRTEPLQGEPESKFGDDVIHIAMVWDSEGVVRAYRDGVRYGKSYRKADPLTLPAGKSRVVFGLRHGLKVAPGRMLKGTLIRARMYDRALSAKDVVASFRGQPVFGRKDVLAALEKLQRQRLLELENKVGANQSRLDALGPEPAAGESWHRLAHAMFNLKEFIFIR